MVFFFRDRVENTSKHAAGQPRGKTLTDRLHYTIVQDSSAEVGRNTVLAYGARARLAIDRTLPTSLRAALRRGVVARTIRVYLHVFFL